MEGRNRMRASLGRSLKKKVGFGRFGLPMWAIGLSVMAITAAAGQAVGPVLTGSVQGTAAVTAEQAVVLSSTSSKHFVGDRTDTSSDSVGSAKGLVVVNDEGTSFSAAIESFVGQKEVNVHLNLDNASNDTANAVLELNIPAGLDVDVEAVDEGASGDIAEARIGPNSWLMKIGPESSAHADDRIRIEIEPKDDAMPGFYNISGRIVQISG